MTYALSLREVSKSYGNTPVLQGISLEVAHGSIAAVVGPSGCGKTTLLRCIAGFETPDAGVISVGDRVVAGGSWVSAHRRAVGYVAQDGALFPHLSVGHNVGFGLPRRQRSSERIAQLLRTLDLDPAVARKRPDELSGGQQQRVSLARALALQPRIMLLDEPFSALDTGLRARTREIAGAALREADIATVLVTHDQEEALSFADQMAVMSDGVFRQVGSPEAVYQHPVDAQTARFVGDTVELTASAEAGVARCALGTVPVSADFRGAVRLVLRPEQVQVSRATETTGCRIVSTGFRGDHVRLVVSVPGEKSPVVLRCSPGSDLNPGDEVRVTLGSAARVDLLTGPQSSRPASAVCLS